MNNMLKFLKKTKNKSENLEAKCENIETKSIETKFIETKTIDNYGEIVECDKEITLYKCKLHEINNEIFVNWEKNRPPDEIRTLQIFQYYIDNNLKIIPGVIYGWEKDNKLYIYDGIHRFLAGQKTNNNMVFLLQVRKTDKESEIINDFLNLNKSVCVPSVYLEEGSVIKKLVCQNIANMLCKKYPDFVSPSRKPYQYNFNRDNIVEFISTLDVDFTRANIDLLIFNELMGLNYVAQDFVKTKAIKCPKKCNFHKFYLFYLEKNLIKRKIEDQLK